MPKVRRDIAAGPVARDRQVRSTSRCAARFATSLDTMSPEKPNDPSNVLQVTSVPARNAGEEDQIASWALIQAAMPSDR